MVDIVTEDKGTPPTNSNGGFVTRRWVEVRTGEFASEHVIRDGGESITIDGTVTVITPILQELYTDATNIGALAQVQSAWVDVSELTSLLIMRKATGGTYIFEIDWARANPGAGAADITETVVVADTSSVEKRVAGKWARFRIRNTSAVTPFSNHRTVVNGR